MFERLNSEQEKVLCEILTSEAVASGYTMVFQAPEEFDYTQKASYINVFRELIDAGFLLETDVAFSLNGEVRIESVTSKARTYFEESERARKEKRSDRAHNYRVAGFSFIGGGLAGALTSFLLSYFNLI